MKGCRPCRIVTYTLPVMKRIASTLLLLAAAALAAEKMTAPQLIEMARKNPAGLRAALVDTAGAAKIKDGTALVGHGADFIWAVDASSRPTMQIDGAAGPAMTKIAGSDTWYAIGKLKPGTSHQFVYTIDGKPFGGSKDVPAFAADSYLKPGVPTGKLSDKMVHISKICDGMRSNYWVYVPGQYDPNTAAALMVFQDGHGYYSRDEDGRHILDAVDNLIHEKKIPVMILVLIQPGDIADSPNSAMFNEIPPDRRGTDTRNPATGRTPLQDRVRSIQYDTVSDRYARFLREEILPEAVGKYNIRKDAYSRAITGLSSGGICAFNVAWFQPDQFSRVLSWIGSFVPLQPEPKWGGQGYPAMVQREPKRNIRVWLQDGAEDQGTWPLQNLEMANQLKTRGYDFHFSYGVGTHNPSQGSAEFPASMVWLWRGYDAGKTEQAFEQDPAEKAKPVFRVQVYNRDHDSTY